MSVRSTTLERMTDPLTTLDKPGLLAEASRVVRERRLGEVRDLEVLSQ